MSNLHDRGFRVLEGAPSDRRRGDSKISNDTKSKAEPYIPPTIKDPSKIVRCPTCGGRVELPCIACSIAE